MNPAVVFAPLCLLFLAASASAQITIPANALLIDLNADLGVRTADGNRVESWTNQVASPGLELFEKQDIGRKIPGSGRPLLKKDLAEIKGHNSVSFVKQELCNKDEGATDSLILGCGFTWLVILKPYHQTGELKDVNTFLATSGMAATSKACGATSQTTTGYGQAAAMVSLLADGTATIPL